MERRLPLAADYRNTAHIDVYRAGEATPLQLVEAVFTDCEICGREVGWNRLYLPANWSESNTGPVHLSCWYLDRQADKWYADLIYDEAKRLTGA